MIVGISVFEIQIPHARSLKEKRRVVKSLVERLHNKHRISIAETDYHDLHQRAEISLAIVAKSESEVTRLLDGIRRALDNELELVVTLWDPELIEGR